MKTLAIIFFAIVAACTPADTDSVPTPEPLPVPAVPQTDVPEWLIGSFQSRWFPESTNITTITDESFTINLSDFIPFNQPYPLTYDLLLVNIEPEYDERHFTIMLDNGINITFRKNDDPSVSDIKIEINERHYGLFKKLDP